MAQQQADKSYAAALHREAAGRAMAKIHWMQMEPLNILTKVQRLRCDFSQIPQAEAPSLSSFLIKTQVLYKIYFF